MDKFTESSKYIEEMCKVIDIEKPERLEVFTKDQLQILFEGLLTGIDTIDAFISCNEFDANQMNEIIDGYRFDIDVPAYLNPKYDWKQMQIIKTMMFRGFTTDELSEFGFFNENVSWWDMNIMMHELCNKAS